MSPMDTGHTNSSIHDARRGYQESSLAQKARPWAKDTPHPTRKQTQCGRMGARYQERRAIPLDENPLTWTANHTISAAYFSWHHAQASTAESHACWLARGSRQAALVVSTMPPSLAPYHSRCTCVRLLFLRQPPSPCQFSSVPYASFRASQRERAAALRLRAPQSWRRPLQSLCG
eukprot:scaffold141868_cov28-Tisochrysis_lutea.AAC.3